MAKNKWVKRLLRKIYPLELREKISYIVLKYYPLNYSNTDVELEFDKKIKLDLCKEDVGHQSIMYNGFYELKLSREIIGYAEKGGLLMDVGANYGYFSCIWAGRKDTNLVVAFEASPANIESLNNNILKNNLSSRVQLENSALGTQKGKMKFDLKLEERQTGWGGLSLGGNHCIEVEVISLSGYCREHNIDCIDVLKIDVEGADTWVLYGAEELLKKKKIKVIFYEQNSERMQNLNIKPEEAQDFLIQLGYKVEKIACDEYYAFIE